MMLRGAFESQVSSGNQFWRSGLYATPNPPAMMPAAVLMNPPMSACPKLMSPKPATDAIKAMM